MATHTYAVSWWKYGETPRVGKLDLRDDVARFDARGVEPLAVDLDDILTVEIARSAAGAGSPPPTLVIRCRHLGPVFVRSVLGFGVLHELADAFAARSAAWRPAGPAPLRLQEEPTT